MTSNRKQINKHEIMWQLNQKNIMRIIHNHTVNGLIGCLANDYATTFTYPAEPCEIKSPVFRAMVDMLTANFIQRHTEKLIEEILDAIEKNETERETP